MLENLPIYLPIFFILTTLLTFGLFQWVLSGSHDGTIQKRAGLITISLSIWLTLQAILALNNIYNSDTLSIPPKIMLFGILPMLLTIVFLFVSAKGRNFMDSLPLNRLTHLNIVRIPVEIGLYLLFLNKVVPEIMTFEGRNFDIFAGITAPIMAWYGLKEGKLRSWGLLIWNFICLALLINIVFIALFSALSPFQKFSFEQPNIALPNFPFVWLPTFIVPIVLFGHLVSIRQLIQKIRT
ncbi:hypothetical protein [Pedobacter gandavensis]|uniref:hypothetical protein n=1 Tax=Pedobacter gandavensis TaxID=2679963 RepID=UPI00292EFAEE|nr:hypothetical protein [Pedobacter gandavensis]